MSWVITAVLFLIAFLIVRHIWIWLTVYRPAKTWAQSGPWASAGYRVPDLSDDRRMGAITKCFDELAQQRGLPPGRDLELAVAQGLVQHSEIQACLDITPDQAGYVYDPTSRDLRG